MLVAFFGFALLFLIAAAVAGVVHVAVDWRPGRWLALHLAFLGGISQLVLGASWFFVGAFLATSPPPRRMIAALLVSWNSASLLVAIGVASHTAPLAALGGGLVVLGLALYALGLRVMQCTSLQRATWAVRWYSLCAVFLLFGALAGIVLAGGVRWAHGDLLAAHVVLNVGGWFGTAIVGTLHTFYPSLTHTRLRFPGLQPAAFAGWGLGVAALAGGAAFDFTWLAAAGWALLLVAVGALVTNVVACLVSAQAILSLPARVVGLGQIFLAAGIAVAAVVALEHGATAPVAGEERAISAVLLLAGWLALTVLGSLVHLLTVLRRVRDLGRPVTMAQLSRDRVITALAAGGVIALAASRLSPLEAMAAPGWVALLVVYAFIFGRVLAIGTGVFGRNSLRL